MEVSWAQVITIVGANVALVLIMFGTVLTLFLWARKEANGDRKQLQEQAERNRKSAEDLVKEIHKEMKEFHAALNSKDTEFKAHMMWYHEKRKETT